MERAAVAVCVRREWPGCDDHTADVRETIACTIYRCVPFVMAAHPTAGCVRGWAAKDGSWLARPVSSERLTRML